MNVRLLFAIALLCALPSQAAADPNARGLAQDTGADGGDGTGGAVRGRAVCEAVVASVGPIGS